MLQIKEKYLLDNGLNSFMMENHFEYFYHLFLPHHQWHSKLYYFTENFTKVHFICTVRNSNSNLRGKNLNLRWKKCVHPVDILSLTACEFLNCQKLVSSFARPNCGPWKVLLINVLLFYGRIWNNGWWVITCHQHPAHFYTFSSVGPTFPTIPQHPITK